jgi:hypothetical protein
VSDTHAQAKTTEASLKATENRSAKAGRESSVRRFLHDLAAPLSALALHLEAAVRKVQRGQDPSDSLQTAQRELAKTFEMFERGRTEILDAQDRTGGQT